MSTLELEKGAGHSHLDRQLWLRWIVATLIGELAGFTVPAIVGPLAYALDLPDLVFVIAIILAGAVEGAILGACQWSVLRRYFPGMRWYQWVSATAGAAVVAYFALMLPNNIGDLARFDWWVLVAGGIILGLLFLLSMGLFQWLVLRRYLPGSVHWITASALAWPLGVLIPVVGIMLVPDNAPTPVFIVVGIVCGLLMGVTVGAITGWMLAELYRKHLPVRK
ncbi:MAG TPA: hypothetical protein VH186_26970 [Chloroflexia bacterium]|nr:hypothetical protein [Chloroflexia bacterium]